MFKTFMSFWSEVISQPSDYDDGLLMVQQIVLSPDATLNFSALLVAGFALRKSHKKKQQLTVDLLNRFVTRRLISYVAGKRKLCPGMLRVRLKLWKNWFASVLSPWPRHVPNARVVWEISLASPVDRSMFDAKNMLVENLSMAWILPVGFHTCPIAWHRFKCCKLSKCGATLVSPRRSLHMYLACHR